MLFYKVEGLITNITEEANDSRKAQRANTRKIFTKSDEFNQKFCRSSFYFVSNAFDGVLTSGVITENSDDLQKTLKEYFKYIDLDLEDISITEITINGIQNLLSAAYRNDYIADDDKILEKYGLDKINGHCGRGIDFDENLIEVKNRDEVYQNTQKFLLSDSFFPELDRIYEGKKPTRAYGHPVHYILQTDDNDTRQEAYQTLLQALYANRRLSSKRYCFLDFRPGESFSSTAYEALYKVCSGGAIVVRYLANDDSEETVFANCERETIEKLCDAAKKYRNQVLTILCLPRECKKSKALFYENFGTISFVEIEEKFVSGEQARAFLKMLAKENHIRTDKALFENLKDETGYLAPGLRTIFAEWYNKKLRTSVFPQYKGIEAVKKEIVKAAPKGNAYDELMEMIGLGEAKGVIQKALNYYKMQKLYLEKGLKRDTPAMHMVFSGNPGTAKTTVARLFARIMKDNGLISKGQLIEVGRGDLVGKYVGWTAQIVQDKFKEAIGGVLFIDEAYSLVDEHSGSYGDEAINTIVQEMENHREDVVVIFAGYPDKMEGFLQKNPGLRSRIAFHVPFADYSAEELCEIATLIGKNKGVTLNDDAMKKLKTIFESVCLQSDFGNGRYVRNILEQAKMNQASRILAFDFDDITKDDILTIKAEDIVVSQPQIQQKQKIGFAAFKRECKCETVSVDL